jgi:hypothetical protein
MRLIGQGTVHAIHQSKYPPVAKLDEMFWYFVGI